MQTLILNDLSFYYIVSSKQKAIITDFACTKVMFIRSTDVRLDHFHKKKDQRKSKKIKERKRSEKKKC
jgi:hypothetical protein